MSASPAFYLRVASGKAAIASTIRRVRLTQRPPVLEGFMRILIALLLSLSLGAGVHAQSGSSGDTPAPSQSPSQPKVQPQAQSRILSDAEALQTISANWNALNGALWIGERGTAANAPNGDCKSELISTQQYEFLLNAERAGLVTIRYWDDRGAFLKEKDYTNKEIIEFAVTGRLQKMTIIPTKKAQQEQTNLEVSGRTGCMFYKVGDYKIEKVTENKPLRKGATEFAAVNVEYTVKYRAINEKIYKVAKANISNRRKANVLLRFDPSTNRWLVAAFDAANIGEEIKPFNIPRAYELYN